MTSIPFALHSRWRVYGIVFSMLLASGCTITPDAPSIPALSTDAALNARASILERQPELRETTAPSQWWKVFNDDTLAQLESKITDNLDLKAAVVRIQESRAQLGLAEAQRQPTLAMDASLGRSALSENSPLYKLGAPSTPSNTWKTGLEAAWELDLWGYQQHRIDSAGANLDAAFYGKEAVRVSVAAEVARNYLLLRGTQVQLDIAQDNLRIAQEMLRLAESRVRNGVASRYDVAAARADIADIQALLLQLQQQRANQSNALALLLGLGPHALDGLVKVSGLPPMPALLPIGVSSDLARNRPDILQAQAKLQAAVADIGAAKADFYPRVRLGAGIGLQAFESSDLADWSSRYFSIGPTFHLPIFEGGKLKNRLALSQARQQLAAIAYQRTVLRAWHEVDEALRAYANERARYAHLQDALAQNDAALAIAQRGYREGAQDFTAVLVARRSRLASQSALADCATASALSVVSLYRALGSGWSPELLARDDKAKRQS